MKFVTSVIAYLTLVLIPIWRWLVSLYVAIIFFNGSHNKHVSNILTVKSIKPCMKRKYCQFRRILSNFPTLLGHPRVYVNLYAMTKVTALIAKLW